MNDLSHKSNDGFNLPENEEWFVVHSGAVTNTNPILDCQHSFMR